VGGFFQNAYQLGVHYSPLKRSPQLDVLRGLAILLVLCRHYSPYRLLYECGWIGVDLFFVLSGFLISGLLFSEIRQTGKISIGRFLIRRGFKIYPPYFFFLAISALIDKPIRWNLYLHQALFLQNYLPDRWAHTWSLAVEEHFYILLPLLIVFLVKRGRLDALKWIPLFALATCLMLRCAMLFRGMSYSAVSFSSHTRFDSLFCGVGLGYLFHFDRKRFNCLSHPALLPICLVLIIPTLFAGQFNPGIMTIGLTLNAIAFSCLLVWALSKNISMRTLEQIGQNSYSIYLWQFAVQPFSILISRPALRFAFGIAGAVVIGIAMAQVVEFPSLAIRDRFFPSISHGSTVPGILPYWRRQLTNSEPFERLNGGIEGAQDGREREPAPAGLQSSTQNHRQSP
jgi:peptidoglycan/LPS O-acetylase OafA/YrhL